MKLLVDKNNNRIDGYCTIGNMEFDENTHYVVEVDDTLEKDINLMGSVYVNDEVKLDKDIFQKEVAFEQKNKLKEEQKQKLKELQQKLFMQSLDDIDAYSVRLLFDEWRVGVTYNIGDRFIYEDKFYKVEQTHKSQEDWLPCYTPSLYTEISDANVEYPEWKQPTGSTTAYNKGDKVTYNGVKYISLIDGNVWTPTDYPNGWTQEKGA